VAGELGDYERGIAEGQILSRLSNHDDHFAAINGSIDRLGGEMHTLVLTLQKYSDAADSRDAITAATAKAVIEAETARRVAAEHKWSGFQKLFAIVAALAAAITIAGVLVTLIAK
jgi:hypothetical protein